MTDDTLPQLLSAIQKSDDGDFLRVLAETTLNRLMDFDAENAIGAARTGFSGLHRRRHVAL